MPNKDDIGRKSVEYSLKDIQIRSPSGENRKLDILKIREQVKKEKYEDTYKTCCSNTDRRCIEFASKLSISLICLLFCIGGILKNKDDCNPLISYYTSLISLIIGYWLPSPSIHGK